MADLGATNARLATSVSLFVLPKSLDQQTLNNPAALLALAQGSTKIGAVQTFTETQRRNTDFRFELDADNPGGLPVERLPRTVDEYSIRIDRAVLYSSTILDILGISADEITNNTAPLAMVKVERAPAGSGISTRTTVYIGLWVHSVAKSYNIAGGDLRVIENVDLGYTSKTVV
jgi:hypothetical protein